MACASWARFFHSAFLEGELGRLIIISSCSFWLSWSSIFSVLSIQYICWWFASFFSHVSHVGGVDRIITVPASEFSEFLGFLQRVAVIDDLRHVWFGNQVGGKRVLHFIQSSLHHLSSSLDFLISFNQSITVNNIWMFPVKSGMDESEDLIKYLIQDTAWEEKLFQKFPSPSILSSWCSLMW